MNVPALFCAEVGVLVALEQKADSHLVLATDIEVEIVGSNPRDDDLFHTPAPPRLNASSTMTAGRSDNDVDSLFCWVSCSRISLSVVLPISPCIWARTW